MFDWLEDVINMLGDTMSAKYSEAAQGVTEDTVTMVFNMLFDFIYMLIYNCIAELLNIIDQSSADLFDLGVIQAFIALFHNIGWLLFVCGIVVAVFDTAIAYKSGQANIKDTCLNVLKGFFAASLVTVVPHRLYSFCVSLQHTFSIDLTNTVIRGSSVSVIDAATAVFDLLSADISPSSLFFIILFGYCVLKVILANVKRGGILLCQIAVGSLYMFSVPRGYTDGFVNWCKQIIATCLTAFLQTSILYVGLISFQEHPIVSIGLCLSATEVPRIAQMYGLDTSTKVNMMAVSQTVNMGSRAVGLIKSASKAAT